MKPRVVVTNFLSRMLISSRALRMDWLIALLFLMHVGSVHSQSIGAVSARQEGEAIVISLHELTGLKAKDLTYFYSMDSGRNWNEIARHCLEFEGEGARWAVLNCMNTDAFDGNSIQFKVEVSSCSPIRFDGYKYRVVQIGYQCWFAENLRTSGYANGDAIRGNLSDREWSQVDSGAQAVYVHSNANLDAYGRLYNWHSVHDARGLCPSGWHVPSDEEWTELTDYLGGMAVAGSQMKHSPSNTIPWDGSNTSGFSALPGGYRGYSYGNFDDEGDDGNWWSSSPIGSNAWYRQLSSDSGDVDRYQSSQRAGFSVRCVQD